MPEGGSSDLSLDRSQGRAMLRQRLEQLVGGTLLSETAIVRLTHRLVERHYAAGEIILHRGVRGGFMGVMLKGRVALFSPTDDQPMPKSIRSNPSVLLLPGSTFGEAMLIDDRPSGSVLQAVADTQLLVLRREDLLDVAGRRWSQPVARWGGGRRYWMPLVFLLVAAVMAVGLFWALNHLRNRATQEPDSRAVAISGHGSNSVQIVTPQGGQVVQRSNRLPVQALLTEPGFYQAQLQVDGQGQAMQSNPRPEVVPWQVDWGWEDPDEGAHTLAVQVFGSAGKWQVSSPVTVTVVPTGTVAFVSNREGMGALYRMGTDGRNPRRLDSGPGEPRRPSWGSNGILAFVVETEPGRALIRQVAESGGEVTDLVSGWDPAWSPAARLMAYSAGVDNVNQLFVTPVPLGTPVQVTAEEAYAGQPTWAPDGRRLAYVAERDGNWDIWVVDADGSGVRQLTDDPAMDWAPEWSPDGSRLAFVSNRGGTHQVYLMRADGSQVQAVTDLLQGAEAPTWSPSGSWLAFVAYTGRGTGVNAREIYLMRADGQHRVRLTYNDFDDNEPDWSPVP